jgi:uncharacterized membrane protein
MGNGIIEWVIGPQLIGVVFIIAGYIQKAYPPKKINNYYGYRTPAAMKNQETWDEANSYSARVMIKTGLVLLFAGLVLTFLFQVIPMPPKIKFALTYLMILASAMGSAITMLTSTERHLEKTFDEHKK